MKLKEMNEALQRLRDKYAVKADGEIVAAKEGSIGNAAELKFADGTICKLLPWRKERRFIELKNLIDNKILEGVSTLRFMNLKAESCIRPLLYRELDLAAFLGEAEVASLFATVNGKTANLIVRLADGKSVSIECSAALPANAEPIDKHEIIARRGVACDRTVDTQVPQASIYEFTADGEKRYTDTDTELFGFELDEILTIRAAYAVLSDPSLAAQWNAIDANVTAQVQNALESDKSRKPVCC